MERYSECVCVCGCVSERERLEGELLGVKSVEMRRGVETRQNGSTKASPPSRADGWRHFFFVSKCVNQRQNVSLA